MKSKIISKFLMLLLVGLAMAAPERARASHFRYGELDWTPTGVPGQIRFNLTDAFRRGYPGTAPDGLAQTGDIITETIGATSLNFGDGTAATGTLRFLVTAFSVTDNFVIGVALNPGTNNPGILHTYAGAGPFTAGINSGDRIGALNNRANGRYILSTTVTPQGTNRSPISTLVPIVTVPQSAAATFLVPAADPDGNPLRWRISTDAQAGGGNSPPNISVNPTTGLVTWNNLGLNTTNFWTLQVIIEDLDPVTGVVRTQTPVDFLLRIVSGPVGSPPLCTINPPGPLNIAVGTPVSFTVTGTDPDPGAVVTLNTGGLPAGAAVVPALPISGASGVNTTFNWTPTAAQVGPAVIIFSATDNTGQQNLCSITINVTSGPIETTPPTCVLTNVGIDPMGKKFVEFTLQDTGSGLASIVPTISVNCTFSIPAFPFGTVAPVIVRATKINQALSARAEVLATDVAGNSILCDPIITTLELTKGKWVRQKFNDVPQAESFVVVNNGNPGLKKFYIKVNNNPSWSSIRLRDDQDVTLDISDFMVPGDNEVTLVGEGKPGDSAIVLIGDSSIATSAAAAELQRKLKGKSKLLREALQWGGRTENVEDGVGAR